MAYEQRESEWDDWIVEEGGSMYDLEERLLEFSARTIRLTESIRPTQAGTHVAKQLLRSSTSPLANHGEAEAAESTNDFIHKMKLCLKEFRETKRWLRLIKKVPLVEKSALLDPLLDETEQLIRIFYSSIRTARKRITKD